MTRIAFVGLGRMGLPMARNLVSAGHELSGYDLDPSRAADAGATPAASPAEAAREATFIVMSLPTPAAVEAVVFGPSGLAGTARPGSLVIDLSTNSPAVARRVSTSLEAIGIGFIDAPVSGGPVRAADGSLSIMVGGSSADVDECRPVLECLGATVFHVGPCGAGQVAKLCNNLLIGVTMVALAEAVAIAESEGIDSGLLYDVLRSSSGDSAVLRVHYPVGSVDPAHPASHGYEPGFSLELLVKDLSLALQLAAETGVRTPAAQAAFDRYQEARARNLGELDYSAVYLLSRNASDEGSG